MEQALADACLLDDARLHSSPVYVHCKAGKSRSVTVVLAYLIYANAWTLKTAYAYVSERRKGISPNIGFVAELMAFEENELGLKQSGGVHGEVPQPDSRGSGGAGGGGDGGSSATGVKTPKKGRPSTGHNPSTSLKSTDKPKPRPSRDSLPPKWTGPSSSLSPRPPRPLPTDRDGDVEGGRESDGDQDREDGKARTLRDEREVMKNGQWVQQRR